MQHKTKASLIAAATAGALTLASFVGVYAEDDAFVPYQPNGKANHHPIHPSNGMANHHPLDPAN